MLHLIVAFTAASGQGSPHQLPRYQPTWESLDTRQNPAWYAEARFGIKIHWGPYAVPGWGPVEPGYDHSGVCKGVGGSCYAEQYERFYRDETHPTSAVHRRVYGADYDYKQFFPRFKPDLYNGSEWGQLFKRSGAKYVYMTAKHSDGFALWPSPANRTSSTQTIGRDLYGELVAGVRGAGLKMGVFYEMEDYFRFGCSYILG